MDTDGQTREALFMEDQVRAGIGLLDGKAESGWRDRLDLGILDMNHMDHCILGQLYGGCENAKTELGLTWGDMEAYGFDVPESLIDYSTHEDVEHVALAETWKTLLTAN